MTIVLIPAPRLAVDSGPTAIPSHVPPDWLDAPTRPISFRPLAAVGLPEPAPQVLELAAQPPVGWSPAGTLDDLVKLHHTHKADGKHRHVDGATVGFIVAAGLTVAAFGCLAAAHTSEGSPAPAPAPVVSPAPSPRTPCDLDPTACGEAAIVPVADVHPLTLGQALGMAGVVAP